MPVLECPCGMVMSTTAIGSRQCCIRCGGMRLRVLNEDTLLLPALRRLLNWPAIEVAVQPMAKRSDKRSKEVISDGSHI